MAYDGPLDIPNIRALFKDNQYSNLPSPIAAKSHIDVAYTLQVNIDQQDDGKYNIVKWYLFDEPQFLSKVTDALIHGIARQPHWVATGHNRLVTKVLFYSELSLQQ